MTEPTPEVEQAPEKPGFFGRAVSRVSKVAGVVKDYQAGVGAQTWDTVKGVGQLQSANIDCLVSGDCRQQAAMVTTLVTNPTTVVTATIDPVRNDWEEGNRARAAGRVALMLGEAIAAKGLTKLGTATTSTARASTAASSGMAGVRATGAAGEAAAGIVKNTTRIPSASGKAAYRTPDELNSSVLGEVKNVKSLGWSSQISDFYNYATARGLEFRLYVRPSTQFRGQLAELYKYDGFTRVDVPGMGP